VADLRPVAVRDDDAVVAFDEGHQHRRDVLRVALVILDGPLLAGLDKGVATHGDDGDRSIRFHVPDLQQTGCLDPGLG